MCGVCGVWCVVCVVCGVCGVWCGVCGVCTQITVGTLSIIHDISKSLCKVCLRQKVAHQLSTVASCTTTAGTSSVNPVCRVQLPVIMTDLKLPCSFL